MQLTVPSQFKFSDQPGTFTGYANVYGVEDLHGDIVEKGAFTKTIAERPRVKILFNHNVNLPIGLGTLEDSPAGLLLHGSLNLESATARDVYSHLRKGVLDALSIGYDVVKSVRRNGARYLTELKLWEVSVVTFPANTLAQILTVKGDDHGDVDAQLRAFNAQMQDDVTNVKARELTRQITLTAAQLRARR